MQWSPAGDALRIIDQRLLPDACVERDLRTEAEMEPYLREPLSEGWKPVYGLPRIGQGTEV